MAELPCLFLVCLLCLALSVFFIAIISRSGGEGTWWTLYVTLFLELGGYVILAMIWHIASRISISIARYPLYIAVMLLSFPLLDIKRLGLYTTIYFSPLWMEIFRYYKNPDGMMKYIQDLSFPGHPPYYPQFPVYYSVLGLVALLLAWGFTYFYLMPIVSMIENIFHRRMYQVVLIYITFPMIDIREPHIVTTILAPFIYCALILKLDHILFMLCPLAFYVLIAWISLYKHSNYPAPGFLDLA